MVIADHWKILSRGNKYTLDELWLHYNYYNYITTKLVQWVYRQYVFKEERKKGKVAATVSTIGV